MKFKISQIEQMVVYDKETHQPIYICEPENITIESDEDTKINWFGGKPEDDRRVHFLADVSKSRSIEVTGIFEGCDDNNE